MVNQIDREDRQSILLVPRPAIFDSHVLAFDISFLFQSLDERGQSGTEHLRRCTAEEADHRHGGLLRARAKWPRCRPATDNRNKLASLHGRLVQQATTAYHVAEVSVCFCITAKSAAVRCG